MRLQLFRTQGERRFKSFLLLEIGMLHIQLHLVEAAKNPISTKLLREERPAPGEGMNLIQMVRNILDTDTAVRDLAIVINTPAIHHQLLSIPQMSKEERQKVLQFELRQASSLREEQEKISFWSAGKIKEQDVVREQVLCAELSQSIIDGLIASAQERNFRLIGFTSYAQMTSHLLKECPLDENQNAALLEVGEHEGSITLFHAKVWNMERHFIISGNGHSMENQSLSELDAEKLKLEVGRALQYFKQQVRNENIDKIFLFGSTRYANEIKALLEASFRHTAVPIICEGKRFSTNAVLEEGKEASQLFKVVHVAALYSDFGRYINFLPHDLNHEKHIKFRQWALAGSAIAGYLLMGSTAFLLNREAARISQCIQPEPPLSSYEQTSPPDQQVQQDRAFALASQKSDTWLRERHYLLAEFVRELATVSPAAIQITGLEVIGKGNGWQVKFDAEIRSSNGSQSQQLLLKFQKEIGRLTCLKQLAWGDVRLMDTDPAADSVNPKHSRNNVLTFTMSGALNQEIFAGKPKPSYPENTSGI
jgi:Tfp pilus assembly PilM family ATPase